MAKKVGDLYVQLGIDSRKFKAGLGKATEGLKTFGMNAMKGLAMVTAAATALGLALGKITKDTVRYGVETDRLVKLLGLTGEQVTKLRYAIEQEHGSVEKLEKGIFNLNIRLGYAGDGLATYTRYFKTLGIEFENTDKTLRNAYDVFLDLVDVVSKGVLSTEDLAAASQLLGARAAKDLIPFMKLGREEIERLGKEAEVLGLVMSTETAAAMKVLDDKITALKGSLKGFRNLIGERIAPAVTGFTDTIVNAFIQIREHIDDLLPSLANLGKDTEKVGDAGVSFAKRTVTAIFTVMNGWKRMELVVAGFGMVVGEVFDHTIGMVARFSLGLFKTILAIENAIRRLMGLKPIADEGPKIVRELAETYGDFADLMRTKVDTAFTELNTAWKTQMEILNNLSPMILHFTKRIKELGDETEKTGKEVKKIAEVGEELKTTFGEIEGATYGAEDATDNLTSAYQHLGSALADFLTKGRDATAVLRALISIGLETIFPGGGFMAGFLGGILGFKEGGARLVKDWKPRFMQEGGATIIKEATAITPMGNIAHEGEFVLTPAQMMKVLSRPIEVTGALDKFVKIVDKLTPQIHIHEPGLFTRTEMYRDLSQEELDIIERELFERVMERLEQRQ